ncbi:hypothetical protein OEA41_008209 [Lepraria neglecta]|uniref:Peptidase M1 leukotriene A4 hydrolase/aminopeptidase C-terminal domain-containing protein n=1 Tax=Lepraria neglecta TaxID=209136 RepID=A0AAD9ZE85_9LECA|nr:hypothetical protein OEA41_008209 [Lepraria neglecta]
MSSNPRSFDTPDVKSTFEFNIKSPLPVLASGLPTGVQDVHSGSEVAAGTKLYSFERKLPIPSYLFALASGDIEKAPIGPRSTVATGPLQLQAAKWELEESTEKFIETIEKIFGETHEFTQLVVDLKGKDPDDAFSSIPYEKGYTFLSYLESQVGKDKWNKFIPHYFNTFARRSLDSYDFKVNLLAFFETDSAASNALYKVDWDAWFYKPGLPPKSKFETSLVDVCYALASKWKNIKAEKFEHKVQDVKGWGANQVVIFLDSVQAFAHKLDKCETQAMGSVYGYAKSGNIEVVARYFQVALRAKDNSLYKPTAELLGNVGRMKFVQPLYKWLGEADRKLAVKTFEKNRDFYHPICRGLIEKDLFGKGSRT